MQSKARRLRKNDLTSHLSSLRVLFSRKQLNLKNCWDRRKIRSHILWYSSSLLLRNRSLKNQNTTARFLIRCTTLTLAQQLHWLKWGRVTRTHIHNRFFCDTHRKRRERRRRTKTRRRNIIPRPFNAVELPLFIATHLFLSHFSTRSCRSTLIFFFLSSLSSAQLLRRDVCPRHTSVTPPYFSAINWVIV